jgi:hypothetical protein
MKTVAVVVPWLLALCVQQPTPPTTARKLTFNWPVGIEARIETELSSVRKDTGETPPATKRVQRLRVLAHPDGRLIQYDPIALSFPPMKSVAMTQLVEQEHAVVEKLVVAPDGRLLKAEHVANQHEKSTQILEALRKELGGTMPAELDAILSPATSEAVLTQYVRQEWDLFVTDWAGLPLQLGLTDRQVEYPNPMLPGVMVPTNVTAGIVSFSPCTRRAVVYECANIESRQSIDPKVMSAAMVKFFTGFAKDLKAIEQHHVEVVTTVRLRLETDTMLPHDLVTEQVNSESALNRFTVSVDRRSSRFIY